MPALLPFLSSYDPLGTSEGTLDPLGTYQLANQLAVELVPAIRERMQRVRFLTAMAVGTLVTEDIDFDSDQRDAAPFLVWEWLVVEALVRRSSPDDDIGGVAGRHMARRAIERHGYLDARSYLKVPRIFGFHGVYKRLAVHLGLTDVDLAAGVNTERLVDAWARDRGLGGLAGAKPLIGRWRQTLAKSLSQRPPRTKPDWNRESWEQLADAFAPDGAKAKEKAILKQLLLDPPAATPGALPALWRLQEHYDPENFSEERLHKQLEKALPSVRPLLTAIRAYERFSRSLQDGFDTLRAIASTTNAASFELRHVGADAGFRRSIASVPRQLADTSSALIEAGPSGTAWQALFSDRFEMFAEPMDASAFASSLCEHHRKIQNRKSAAGKRPWFDQLGPGRIFVRPAYRSERPELMPSLYVHEYRGRPIGRFRADLS